jgi:hypothetical protein
MDFDPAELRKRCEKLSSGDLLRMALVDSADYSPHARVAFDEVLRGRLGDLQAYLADELAKSGEVELRLPAGRVTQRGPRGPSSRPVHGTLVLTSTGIGFIGSVESKQGAGIIGHAIGGPPVGLIAHMVDRSRAIRAFAPDDPSLPISVASEMFPRSTFFVSLAELAFEPSRGPNDNAFNATITGGGGIDGFVHHENVPKLWDWLRSKRVKVVAPDNRTMAQRFRDWWGGSS